jgi:hypothetical protein
MLTCREVTRLVASDALAWAPLRRRLEVRLHLLMCEHCSRYVRELRAIGAALRSRFKDHIPSPTERLELRIREGVRAEAARLSGV